MKLKYIKGFENYFKQNCMTPYEVYNRTCMCVNSFDLEDEYLEIGTYKDSKKHKNYLAILCKNIILILRLGSKGQTVFDIKALDATLLNLSNTYEFLSGAELDMQRMDNFSIKDTDLETVRAIIKRKRGLSKCRNFSVE